MPKTSHTHTHTHTTGRLRSFVSAFFSLFFLKAVMALKRAVLSFPSTAGVSEEAGVDGGGGGGRQGVRGVVGGGVRGVEGGGGGGGSGEFGVLGVSVVPLSVFSTLPEGKEELFVMLCYVYLTEY